MRFFANGPSIPDELLIARDEGRVIFFCGAGVSRARAGLLDFFGLAKQVVESLGVPAADPVRQLIDEAEGLAERGQVAHVVSSAEGAKKFALTENPSPAEWLCVFDRGIRYLTPSHIGDYDVGEVIVRIGEALPSLQKDRRLIVLLRRWNSL